MTFSEELKKARAKAGLSQQKMANMLEMPKHTIENWEMEIRTPPVWTQRLILEKLEQLAHESTDS